MANCPQCYCIILCCCTQISDNVHQDTSQIMRENITEEDVQRWMNVIDNLQHMQIQMRTKEKQFDEIETWYKSTQKSKHTLGGGGVCCRCYCSSPSVYLSDVSGGCHSDCDSKRYVLI